MSSQVTVMERRIRRAAIIILIGLLGTLGSLLSNHPLAFVEFVLVGLTLILIGVIYYLITLVRGEPRRVEQA
jgi:hypothetical protein